MLPTGATAREAVKKGFAILVCEEGGIWSRLQHPFRYTVDSDIMFSLLALSASCFVQTSSVEEAITVSDKIAPEHLEVQTKDASKVRRCGSSCSTPQ